MDIIASAVLVAAATIAAVWEAGRRKIAEDELTRTEKALRKAEKDAAKLRRENVILHVRLADIASERDTRVKELQSRLTALERSEEAHLKVIRHGEWAQRA